MTCDPAVCMGVVIKLMVAEVPPGMRAVLVMSLGGFQFCGSAREKQEILKWQAGKYMSWLPVNLASLYDKQRVLMHRHQGWNVRHGLCHIYMIYVYIWVVYSFCLFCCLFIIVTTQFVALYKSCKPKPKPSTYDPPDNHPLAEIQRPILRPEPKQQICHQHANTDHFGK